MADAHGALDDLAEYLSYESSVESARVVERTEHDLLLVVELAAFNPDTWDRIIRQVDDLARDQINSASIDLDIKVLSGVTAR